jgi:hypothetical protein
MAHILYRCPATALKVGCWLDDIPEREKPTVTYQAMLCPACTRLHFVHRETGKVLGSDDEQS